MKNHLNSVVFILILTLWPCAYGQVNLVPNPSFEEYLSCPDDLNQVDSLIAWKNYGNSPDFFHACATSFADVPFNSAGYQQPASGFGYAGLLIYEGFTNYREFIGVELTSSLNAGTTYYASMKINFANIPGADPEFEWWNCATSKLGMRFSNSAFSEFSPHPIDNFCHILDETIITDTLTWFRVFGSFTPASTFDFLVIGNFFDDSSSDTLMLNSVIPAGYYYIDDVVVSTDSAFAQDFVGKIVVNANSDFSIYPNPIDKICQIELMIQTDNDPLSVQLVNPCGQVVMVTEFFGNQLSLDLSQLPAGIYLVQIIGRDIIHTESIVKY